MTETELKQVKLIAQRQQRGYTLVYYDTVSSADYTEECDDTYIDNLIIKYGLLQLVSGFSAEKVHDAYNDGFSDRQENSKNFDIDNYR